MLFREKVFAGAVECCHSWLRSSRERIETEPKPLIPNPAGTEGQVLINVGALPDARHGLGVNGGGENIYKHFGSAFSNQIPGAAQVWGEL